ncbi:MAG: DNA-3-methyladenine glycosylase [Candidatus Obscuribacterales bacterium]|nr:DNA-3-methyladenine glycosylase [Candidatus Obscuribacterales bacterium]
MATKHKSALVHLQKQDPLLAKVIEQVGPYKLAVEEMQNCFETLLESIVYQQLTGKAAATILGRVKTAFGKGKFPTPQRLLKASDDELRSAGLSYAKVAAIKDLAAKTLAGEIPEIAELSHLSDEEIIRLLSSVRGIGEWTVQMLLIFRLGRPDVLPTNDYGVRKGFAKAYGLNELPKPKELLQAGECWRPYRSVAAWYLWRILDTPNKITKTSK